MELSMKKLWCIFIKAWELYEHFIADKEDLIKRLPNSGVKRVNQMIVK